MNKQKRSLYGGPQRYLFLLPALIIYSSVVIYPTLNSLYLSFFKWNGINPVKTFVGFRNYINLFTVDSVFMMALKNNLLWMVLTIVFTATIALALALLINMKFRGRMFARGVLYFPYILSGVMVALTWKWIYHPQLGLLNNLFIALGHPEWSHPVLADSATALPAAFVAGCWHYVGAPMVLFLAGLSAIPADLTEAASIDGANRLQGFLHITIPMLRETLLIVLATQIINSMKVYDIIYALTGGGPAQSTQTLATWMVTQTFTFANLGAGTAIAWVMMLIMMAIVIPYVTYMSKN